MILNGISEEDKRKLHDLFVRECKAKSIHECMADEQELITELSSKYGNEFGIDVRGMLWRKVSEVRTK